MFGGRYAETLIWTINNEGGLQHIVAQTEAPEDSLHGHHQMLKHYEEERNFNDW